MYSDIPKPIIKTNLKPSTKATSAVGVRKNMEWLKKHHRKYQGQWIALNEGILLGSNENGFELYKAMTKSHQLPVALFINLK